jgi:uncharacterized protein YcfL
MKKVFAVAVIALTMTACGNSKSEQTSDSTAVAVDSTVVAQDTTSVVTDSTATK